MMERHTFRVTTSLNFWDIQNFPPGAHTAGLIPLEAGTLGRVPRLPANYEDQAMTRPRQFVLAELLVHTNTGLVLCPGPGPAGTITVPLNNIEIGPIIRGPPRVVSSLLLHHPTLGPQGSHGSSPLRRFLETFYSSFATLETQKALADVGVCQSLTRIIVDDNKRSALVKTFLNGKILHGSFLAWFSNLTKGWLCVAPLTCSRMVDLDSTKFTTNVNTFASTTPTLRSS